MAVSRNSSGAVSTSTTSTLSVAYPANNVGDILILAVGFSNSATATTPANWTLLNTNNAGGNGTSPMLYVYWREVTSPLSGSETVTWSTANNNCGFMVSYSGAAGTVPTNTAFASSASNSVQSSSVSYSGFAIWFLGFSSGAALTLSGISSTDGSWSQSYAEANSQANFNYFLLDGPIASVTTTLNATASGFSPQTNIAFSLSPGSNAGVSIAWLTA